MPSNTAIPVEGAEAVSSVLLDLLNRFPGLEPGERIQFATIGPDGGIGFFPNPGAVTSEHKQNVLGQAQDTCRYPFSIVYNAALKTERQRLRVKEFLDTLGRWLEGQPVTIGGQVYKLDAYPDLELSLAGIPDASHKIQAITRLTAAHLNAAYPDGMEDWVFSAALTYRSEYIQISMKG
ncbi:MAG: hypothetical protein IJT94_00115 [Oscillibacter sp.]|nr:hypothetical protein [Oscillibacter sp.]